MFQRNFDIDVIADTPEEAEAIARDLYVSGDAVMDGGELEFVGAEKIANSVEDLDDEHDPFLSDSEADADALASAGMGTDEDYGSFGGNDD
jgi:hypothetical protein